MLFQLYSISHNEYIKDHKISKKRKKTEGVSLVHDTPSVFILRYTKPFYHLGFPTTTPYLS